MCEEIPLEREHQRGVPPKKSLDPDLLRIITSTADELSNIDDLERP